MFAQKVNFWFLLNFLRALQNQANVTNLVFLGKTLQNEPLHAKISVDIAENQSSKWFAKEVNFWQTLANVGLICQHCQILATYQESSERYYPLHIRLASRPNNAGDSDSEFAGVASDEPRCCIANWEKSGNAKDFSRTPHFFEDSSNTIIHHILFTELWHTTWFWPCGGPLHGMSITNDRPTNQPAISNRGFRSIWMPPQLLKKIRY